MICPCKVKNKISSTTISNEGQFIKVSTKTWLLEEIIIEVHQTWREILVSRLEKATQYIFRLVVIIFIPTFLSSSYCEQMINQSIVYLSAG